MKLLKLNDIYTVCRGPSPTFIITNQIVLFAKHQITYSISTTHHFNFMHTKWEIRNIYPTFQ